MGYRRPKQTLVYGTVIILCGPLMSVPTLLQSVSNGVGEGDNLMVTKESIQTHTHTLTNEGAKQVGN